MLDAGWVEANHELRRLPPPLRLRRQAAGRAARDLSPRCARRGKPLVFTVHDLRNPHHPDRDAARRAARRACSAAAALITLTQGAADEIARAVGPDGRRAPAPARRRPRRRLARAAAGARPGFVVGLHAKSLRAEHGRPGRAPPCSPTRSRDLPGARLQINVHHEVFDPDAHCVRRRSSAQALRRSRPPRPRSTCASTTTSATTSCGPTWPTLDVSVLPYRFGTHSRLARGLPRPRDGGRSPPRCGFYAEQRPCLTYGHDEDGLDAGSLAARRARGPRQPAAPPRATSTDAAAASARRSPPRTPALRAVAA